MKFLEKIHSWNSLTEVLKGYFQSMQDSPVRKPEALNTSLMLEKLSIENQQSALSDNEIIDLISNYLEYSVRTTHPNFNNQLQAGPRFEALLAEIVSFVTSTTMATYEVAPLATLIEAKLIDFINSKIGFVNGGGIMLTGGSNANLQALIAARNNLFPETKAKGSGEYRFAVFVSSEAHYSFLKAMNIMGLGSDNLFTVDVDERGRMLISDLEAKLEKSKALEMTPLMVASTCGTTVRGAFDPLIEIQTLCSKYKVWHHADAAWGGLLLFSPYEEDLIAGIGDVDSVTFDAHKGLGAGLITSFILTKEKDTLFNSNSGGGKEYLFHEEDDEVMSSGQYSLQCGRKVDALKLWLILKSLGTEGLEDLVTRQKSLAIYFENKITKSENFELFYKPEFLNVCFRVLPKSEMNVNDFNLALRKALIAEGKFFINYATNSSGDVFFRMSFANHETTQKHLDALISHLENFKLPGNQ